VCCAVGCWSCDVNRPDKTIHKVQEQQGQRHQQTLVPTPKTQVWFFLPRCKACASSSAQDHITLRCSLHPCTRYGGYGCVGFGARVLGVGSVENVAHPADFHSKYSCVKFWVPLAHLDLHMGV
jgi:hypothetical protein